MAVPIRNSVLFVAIELTGVRLEMGILALIPGLGNVAWRQASDRRLFSSMPCPKKPGPKGPDEALVQAIVELKSRNPRFGCPRIARIISQTFGMAIDKNVVSRVLSKHSRPAPGGTGPSWLSFIGQTTACLWSVDLFRCESLVRRSDWCSWSWTRSRVASSASACMAAPSRAPTFAACSTWPFVVRAHPRHLVSSRL